MANAVLMPKAGITEESWIMGKWKKTEGRYWACSGTRKRCTYMEIRKAEQTEKNCSKLG